MTESATPQQTQGIRSRVVLAGLLLIAVSNIWAGCSEHYLRSSWVGVGHLPMAVLLPFLLVVIANAGLKRLRRGLGFNTSELLLLFVMAFAGNAAGAMAWMSAVLATPYYFATSENKWDEHFHPYLPKWLVPSNEAGAMEWFYGGLPEGERIPWEVWVQPLFWWFALIAASLLVSMCLASMLRRQWVVAERLSLPLARVPLVATRTDNPNGIVPTVVRSRLFWIGAAIPLFIITWNVVGYFNPQFPAFPIGRIRYLRLARYFPGLRIRVNFFLLSLGYLANLDVLFSIWFFHALALVQIGLFNRFAVAVGPASEWSNCWWLVRFQGTGGYIFVACWTLWLARRHLIDAVRKSLGRASPAGDRGELMSHRWAVIGFVGGLAYIVFWARAAGFSPGLLALYLAVAFLFAVGLAKFIAESGLVYLGWPFSAHQFAVFSIGSLNLSPQCLTAAAVSDARGIFGIVRFIHIAKLADEMHFNKRSIAKITCLSVLAGALVAVVFAIYMGYTYGAYNTGHWSYVRGNQYVYNRLVKKLTAPVGPDWAKMSLVAGGALFTAIITFLRYRFTWFNLHPIGFTVATMWPVRTAAVSFFIVWLAKLIVLRIGGVKLAQKAFPFFIGMLLGYSLATGISFVVDAIWFPGAGHLVHYW